jgi:hypothetical protein
MRPVYEIRAWREHGWWLARVVGASEGADEIPVDAFAHARTLTSVEQAARDLVATILDADEDSFEIDLEYVLPDEVETVVCEAIGARTWLDAAHQLWEDHSAVAVHTLLRFGFSPHEAAKLLGISDRLIDDLLDIGLDPDRRLSPQ